MRLHLHLTRPFFEHSFSITWFSCNENNYPFKGCQISSLITFYLLFDLKYVDLEELLLQKSFLYFDI